MQRYLALFACAVLCVITCHSEVPNMPPKSPATIAVSAKPLYPGTISPLIYGEFIELLNDLIPGMWAEKVDERSFEGQTQPWQTYPPGIDWTVPRWKPFDAGQPVFTSFPESQDQVDTVSATAELVYDAHNPYAGHKSAQVNVKPGDGRPFVAGIMQDKMGLKKGQALSFSLYARGKGPIKVLLGRQYGAFFQTYASLEFKGVTDEWQQFAGRMVPDTTDDNASLAIGISSEGMFWLDKVSLMPVDNKQGWRPDVVEAIKAMKPGVIRWGGSSLIFYDWKIGLGPSDKRPAFENRPWGNMEENDVGTFEFLEFCELTNSEPLICLNSNTTTIDDILNEIEFCNGPAESTWGKVRAEMGHPKPFDVKYWQIGNEQWGEEYEHVLVSYAKAIRVKYPKLQLMAAAPSERMLTELSDVLDFVCPHWYEPYHKGLEQGARGLIKSIHERAKNKNLKLGITEWNHTAGQMGWARSWLQTLYNGINGARMLSMYQRLGDMVRIANRSNMTNSSCSGTIQTNRAGQIYMTPMYYVQKAYANLSGDLALGVTFPAGPLDGSATLRKRTGEVALFVVNTSPTPQAAKLDLSAFKLKSKEMQVWTISGPTLDSVNNFVDPHRVVPGETTAKVTGSYTFPGYSVTVLRLR